jgi:hypothetical protein
VLVIAAAAILTARILCISLLAKNQDEDEEPCKNLKALMALMMVPSSFQHDENGACVLIGVDGRMSTSIYGRTTRRSAIMIGQKTHSCLPSLPAGHL